jgi:methylase of polypeptide subunit release factors
VNYELAYRVGFHPWEDAEAHSPFTEKISELFGQEESGREPPYGLALDLGTGSGIWAVQLAKRGWQVTGVELVEKALRRAHDRVQAPKPIEVLLRPDEHWYRLRRESAARSD